MDVDITAMARLPWHNILRRKQRGESGRQILHCPGSPNIRESDGGFCSSMDTGTESSESCAQVLTALCSLGIDPQSDSRFIKNGNTVLDNLM